MSTSTRREFLARAGQTALAAALAQFLPDVGAAESAPVASQAAMGPNILYIMTDQQRADSLGCYGNPWVKTPNLDALAARGALFNRYFIQSPVCVPSRTSLLTGLYPHQTGILENSTAKGIWPEGATTYPEEFAKAGYYTYTCGKAHHPAHKEHWQTSEKFVWFKDEVMLNKWGAGYDKKEHEVLERPPSGMIFSGIYPTKVSGRTNTSHLADLAIKELQRLKDSPRPFLLRVSIMAPHTPVLPPRDLFLLHDPQTMEVRRPTAEELQALPKYERTSDDYYDKFSDEEIKRLRASYHALVTHVDDQVGRLVQVLKENGQYENTIVVFTSDHGQLNGEHNQYNKRVFYDATTRVPLILAGPGVAPGQRIERLTEGVDLAPTLFRLSGLPVPEQMRQGRDLFDERNPREFVIGEVAKPTREDGSKKPVPLRRSWIRTERWSMDYTSEINHRAVTSAEERDGKLIDLLKDTEERKNLYYDPQYASVVQDLTARFESATSQNRRPLQFVAQNGAKGEE